MCDLIALGQDGVERKCKRSAKGGASTHSLKRRRAVEYAAGGEAWQVVVNGGSYKVIANKARTKRRKRKHTCQPKTKKQQGVALPSLLLDGLRVVKLQRIKDCRLAREVNSPVYTAPFRYKKIPIELKLWPGNDHTANETMFFMAGKKTAINISMHHR